MPIGGTVDTTLNRVGTIDPVNGGGATGNERLTAITGAVLLVLLAVIGLTLLRLRTLLSVHLFVGLLLIPPVLLKMASTGYRFVRYYTHDPTYLRKGPPEALMRMIAPVLVLSTVVVFVSGFMLLAIGPSSRRALLPIHKVSFIVWVAFTALHVLGHLSELPRALGAQPESDVRVQIDGSAMQIEGSAANAGWDPRAGRAGRILSLSGALVGGLVLAVVFVPQFAPWLHAQHQLLTGGR